jgi:putative DNA primase/helicase
VREYAIVRAPRRNSWHWTPDRVTWDEVCRWPETPADTKDSGGYLFGTLRETTDVHKGRTEPCTGLHRRKDAIVSRSVIACDVDFPALGFLERVELTFPYAALIHTTYSSSPDDLRYRLLVPTDRELAPDEYVVANRAVQQMLGGAEQFDPSTDQPERFMFLPAAQQPDWFTYLVLPGEPISVDQLLRDFVQDLSHEPFPRPSRNKRDPATLEGVIGAFNRAYDDWDLLIEVYELPYAKVSDDRYQLAGTVSVAGMGPIPDAPAFVYSHHANDPAYGQACSAFDLVRLHRFGQLDEGTKPQTPINKLPSQDAMLDLASGDHRVTAELVGLDFAAVMDDEIATPDEWKLGLRRAQRTGKFVDCVHNWDLVRAHDPLFALLYYNELTLSPELAGDVPWRKVSDRNRILSSNDRWEWTSQLERDYGVRVSKDFVSGLLEAQAWRTVRNPIRDYLDKLVWDGVPRVEECLPGVRPTTYTRLVARKVMVAAVARMFNPGCKWDHTPVLYGKEGLGKTWWVERVGLGYTSALGRIDNKDTLLVCQRSWIVLADENHSMRKTDQDAQKEFLTRTSDMFRMPYDRETLAHPRHWVVWSTTNDDTFLSKQEGNRRFLTVHCEDPVDFDAITDAYIDQLWAEAVTLYRAGEPLFLAELESTSAAAERERFVEEDVLSGLVEEFLETLVPDDWWERDVISRQQWFYERSSGFVPPGTMRLDRVCSAQIWTEALGRKKGDARRTELLEITNVLKRMPGWTAGPNRHRLPGYGPQLVFTRTDLL